VDLASDGQADSEKNEPRPHLKKTWCIGAITGEYPARLEACRHLYALPFEESRPAVCYNERPVQLLGEVAAPRPPAKGKPVRFDYEYRRAGTANILLAIEPLSGRRVVEISAQRTKADYARFKRRVADKFPETVHIVSIEDNLNTHNAGLAYGKSAGKGICVLVLTVEFLENKQIRAIEIY
jgi:hypothetical protein